MALASQPKPGELAVLARHYAGRPEYSALSGILEGLAEIAEAADAPQPMTAPEVAAMLGIKESLVWEWKRQGQIPYAQPMKGGKVLFDREEVLRWWHSRRNGGRRG